MGNILEPTKYQTPKPAIKKNMGGGGKRLDSPICLSLPGLLGGRQIPTRSQVRTASQTSLGRTRRQGWAAPVAPERPSVLGERSKSRPHNSFLMPEFPLVFVVLSCAEVVPRALPMSVWLLKKQNNLHFTKWIVIHYPVLWICLQGGFLIVLKQNEKASPHSYCLTFSVLLYTCSTSSGE